MKYVRSNGNKMREVVCFCGTRSDGRFACKSGKRLGTHNGEMFSITHSYPS